MNNKQINLSFDDGFKELTINNDPNRVIKWNPSDVNFVDRFLAFQEWVEKEFKSKLEKLGITEDNSFDNYDKGAITKLGDEMNEAINLTFGRDITGPAFLGANPISPVSNGSLLFMNFIEALTPVIESSINDFDKAREKYTGSIAKITKI